MRKDDKIMENENKNKSSGLEKVNNVVVLVGTVAGVMTTVVGGVLELIAESGDLKKK